MNTINASTGFSGFQLKSGHSPKVMLPLVPAKVAEDDVGRRARSVIARLQLDMLEAHDNLLKAKIVQAEQANKGRAAEVVYKVGDRVRLSTLNRRNEFKKKGEKRAAKFFPRYDGPYKVIAGHPEMSTYTLELPAHSNIFPTFHSSELLPFCENDDVLFAGRKKECPGPVIMDDGSHEYVLERILDSKRYGRGRRFLVAWKGWGPEHDLWLPGAEVRDTAALEEWLKEHPEDE